MAGGNGLDMLGAEDQPHPPFARHPPQGALLAGWSLLIACSPLHVVSEIDVMACCCCMAGPSILCRETVWRQDGRGWLTHISCACACSSSTRFASGRAWPAGCGEQSGPGEDRGPAGFPVGARPRRCRRSLSRLRDWSAGVQSSLVGRLIRSAVASRASFPSCAVTVPHP